eukprot:2212157-Rhodomonas_salina.3
MASKFLANCESCDARSVCCQHDGASSAAARAFPSSFERHADEGVPRTSARGSGRARIAFAAGIKLQFAGGLRMSCKEGCARVCGDQRWHQNLTQFRRVETKVPGERAACVLFLVEPREVWPGQETEERGECEKRKEQGV